MDPTNRDDPESPLCPSARPEMAGAVIFGVVGGTVEQPRVAHLARPLPVTDELLALVAPVSPLAVYRTAAPCAASACVHFKDDRCRLATRAVQTLPLVAEVLPACRIRRDCRWWRQEGADACRRCPMVVTEVEHPSDVVVEAGDPLVYAAAGDS